MADGYIQRTSGWFPNNTRIVSPSSAGRGVLKVKAKVIPRKLQPWQAYHALTYESRWKSSVNTAWNDYKEAWAAEHPDDKKPPKNRFQIMVDFMKDKFTTETEEMKQRCEEYRMARQLEKASPSPATPESTRNAEFQA